MTVTTNKSATLDDVTESTETYLDKVFNRIATKYRGKKVAALEAWNSNELWVLGENLKHHHGVAIAELKNKHQQELKAQRDAWIQAQKLKNTAHCLDRYGTLDEMERMGFITTKVDEAGFVEWEIAKCHQAG